LKNFALTGAAGYIAPRHLKAIQDTGSQLVAALDKHDSVGILDSYFPDCAFFTEYERFDRHLEKLHRENDGSEIHYLSICSPNYLHDAHIRTALRVGADALCEKPLVLNPWNVAALQELEADTGQRVWTILQLRVHPALIALREKIQQELRQNKYELQLTYLTSRGQWYLRSWKGDDEKSGGLATNIGVHFFDMLTWLFGKVERNEVHYSTPTICAGYLELEKARVPWFLSIEIDHIPTEVKAKGQRTYRSITIDGEEIEFSGGFTDLHTLVYQQTLTGQGFGLEEAKTAIQIVHDIRNTEPTGVHYNSHPILRKHRN
jgi:UDP-N-acetyl-2-amino-2-deoxyglucuronate dehydrogenase